LYDKLCEVAETKDACQKVKLNSDSKRCCFYTETFSDGNVETGCFVEVSDDQIKDAEKEGITIKEECTGRFIKASILVLLSLFL
jgi:hypothetical protein